MHELFFIASTLDNLASPIKLYRFSRERDMFPCDSTCFIGKLAARTHFQISASLVSSSLISIPIRHMATLSHLYPLTEPLISILSLLSLSAHPGQDQGRGSSHNSGASRGAMEAQAWVSGS
jgi:hypothetical protein